MNSKDHKKKTISGLKWNMISQLVTQAITFGIGILLMRLLDPSDFGLLGMVTVFTGFVGVFKDFGLTRSLIQKEIISEIDKNTIFYTNIAVSIILTLTLILCSNYIAIFYNIPELKNMAIVIALLFTIQSFGMVHHALMIKTLNFKKVFIVRIVTIIVSGSFAVYFALNGYGVWTLIYQQFIAAVTNALIVWFMIEWRPRYIFSYSNLKLHFKFGLPLLANNNLTYWSRNTDNLLIGKFLNAESLGLYSRGYNLMMLPINQVSKVISNVMMPSLSIIQNDKGRVRLIYLKITRTVAFITFPMMGILHVTANPMVEFVFGKNWIEIIPLLKIFAIIGALQSLGFLSGVIYLSQGKTKDQFKVNIFTSALNVLAFIIGVQFDIYGVVIAYLISSLINNFINYFFMGRIIDLYLKTIFSNIAPHIILALILSLLGVYTISFINGLPNYLQVILLSLEYLLGWFVLMHLVNPKMLLELKALISDFKK